MAYGCYTVLPKKNNKKWKRRINLNQANADDEKTIFSFLVYHFTDRHENC